MFATIILFIVLFGLLGYGVSSLLNLKFSSFLKETTMTFAIGLGTFPIIAIILNLVHIPLHWMTFMLISLSLALGGYYLRHVKNSAREYAKGFWKQDPAFYAVLLVTMILFGIMLSGSYSYPYLEDDDPWKHASAALYISETHTAYEPAFHDYHYIDPYPPVYDIFMAILFQTNTSVSWVLKFFNVVLLALAIPFAYLYFLRFTKRRSVAALGAFILAALPSFMSHFIWAQTYAVMLFFPALYAFERMLHKEKSEKGWLVVFILVSCGIYVTQPSAAFIFVVFLGLRFIAHLIFSGWRSSIRPALGVIGGLVLAQFFWIDAFVRYGISGTLEKIKFSVALVSAGNADTSGGLVYGFMDFFHAPISSKIDQATGIGSVVTIFAIIGVLVALYYVSKHFKQKQNARSMSTEQLVSLLLIFAFSVVGTLGNILPIKLFPHRFWVFLSIPVALLAAYGFMQLIRATKVKYVKIAIVIIFIILVCYTSAYPKKMVQTATWPSGGMWTSTEEIQAFASLESLPDGTKIFVHTSEPTYDNAVIGYDMYSCLWCEPVYDFRQNIMNVDGDAYTAFLKQNGYEYVIISGMSYKTLAQTYGENETVAHLNELIGYISQSTQYTAALQHGSTYIFRVN